MELRIRSFNAWRAARFGYKLTMIDKLIMRRSPLHTHTELQFSSRYADISFSATTVDKTRCTRFKDITYSHPEYWDTLLIPVTSSEEDAVYAEAKKIEGQPYDVKGLASFVSKAKIIRPSASGWWCTEAVLHCLFKIPRLDALLPLLPDETHPTLCHVISCLVLKTDLIEKK